MPRDTTSARLEATDELLTKLRAWFQDAEDTSAENRAEAEKDCDYYHGIQWTDEEVKELEDRGQPVLTFNRIAPKINYVLGDEILKRVDPKAVPRTPAHEDASEAVTDALRYVDDAEDFDGCRSSVFEDVSLAGWGGAVVEVEKTLSLEPVAGVIEASPAKNEDQGGGAAVNVDATIAAEASADVEIKLRHVPWDRIFWDPHSRKHDFSDARYVGVVQWLDLEDAKQFYPNAAAVLERTLSDQGGAEADTYGDKPTWVSADRKRVRIVEIYWKEKGEYQVAHFTGGGFAQDPKPTGYLDEKGRNECPFILTSAFITRECDRYGLVRNMRSPQDEVNKRRSKALHRLNTKQVVAEDGVVEEPESARHELSRPDGWVTVKPGRMTGLQIQQDAGLANADLQMLEEAKREIDDTGPSINVLMDPNASGRAQLVRQKAASVPLEKMHDHLHRWTRSVYTQIWHRVRQYWTFEKWLRVEDKEDRKGFRFVGINRVQTRAQRLQELMEKQVPLASAMTMVGVVDPQTLVQSIMGPLQQQAQMMAQQGQQIPPQALEQQGRAILLGLPQMQERIRTNALDNVDADILIEETPDTTVIEQEEFEELVNLARNGMQIPPELIIEASQLRSKRRLLEMIRQQPNPQAQQMSQLQIEALASTNRKTVAQAAQAEATAAKLQGETQALAPKAQRDAAEAQKTQVETQRIAVGMQAPQVPPRPPTGVMPLRQGVM